MTINRERQTMKSGITLTDFELAQAYYPILVETARQNKTITYGLLVKTAKKKYPEIIAVQNAIAVSVGRRLNAVRIFTSKHQLPDISSLVINISSGDCGKSYLKNFNPDKERSAVYAHDWNKTVPEFREYLSQAKLSYLPPKIVRKVSIKKSDANVLMSKYYYAHKSSLPRSIIKQRDNIIALIMTGISAENAYEEALKNLSN